MEEIRKALDESDREEQSQDDSNVEAIAEKWEKAIRKRDSSEES